MTLPVDVVRSRKRRKTVQAREVDGRLKVMIPAWMSAADESHWVAEMQRRTGRTQPTLDNAALADRAAALAGRYRLPTPATTVWSDRQGRRWGSCTPATSTVRISSRVAKAPAWVLDFVIVHELAHLVVAAHDARFSALVERYPRSQRAQGFLEGWGLADDGDGGGGGGGDGDGDGAHGSGPSAIIGIDHVRIPVPAGRRDEVTAFYAGALGLTAIDRPGPGLWFGDEQVRLLAQPGATGQAHLVLAVRGFTALVSRLAAAGHDVHLEGTDHCSVEDPFGNRVELIDRTSALVAGDAAPTDLRRPRRHPSTQDDSAAALT